MGARGPMWGRLAHSPTGLRDQVIERVSNERKRDWGDVEEGEKKESEPLINILIRSESRAVRFVSLTIMIRRDNASERGEFRMSNNTPPLSLRATQDYTRENSASVRRCNRDSPLGRLAFAEAQRGRIFYKLYC